MAESTPEADFHSILYTRLNDYIHRESTPFDDVHIEEDTNRGRADIFIKSALTGELVIEVKRDDVYPLEKEVIKQARDYADDVDADFFATCNSNDFFLFHYSGEVSISDIPYYYLDLRDVNLYDPSLDGGIPTILKAVRHLTEEQSLPRQRDRDQIVGLLRSFHTAIWPTFRALIREDYEDDPQLTDEFDEWVHANDYANLDRTEQFEIAAKQYAYLLTNRILFYEVVRGQTPGEIPTESGFKLDSLQEGVSVEGTERHLRQQFRRIQEEIDYEPVFEDEESLFANIPHNAKTRRSIHDLLESIEAQTLTQIDEDLLGELYEELIPEEERRELGQFYTHPDIAEAICNWALPESLDRRPRVLDPASGSGTFTVEAYNRIQSLYPTTDHQSIIDDIVAVDINRFPLHLTALNLASRDITSQTEELHTFNDSFFNFSPDDSRLDKIGNSSEFDEFDAVVGNPPYIRQESLYPTKDHFRSHLRSYGRENTSPYYDGSKKLSMKSDAYIYFVTHALQFLRDGGRLGFIVPTKWLDTKYGEDFQEFLYEHTKVHAVVGFSSRAFEALVDTVLLFVERCKDDEERKATTTDFVRVTGHINPDTLESIAEYEREVPSNRPFHLESHDDYRVVSRRQADLAEEGGQKLGYYLYSPAPFIPLVDSQWMVELETYADVAFGNKTGANKFFFVDEQDVSQWDIPEKFLQPAVKSIKGINTLVLKDTDLYLLDFNDYVNRIQNRRSGLRETTDLAKEVKQELINDGYESVKEYIDWGENQGYHQRKSVQSNNPWFNLENLLTPDVLHPVFYNERVFTIDNVGGFAPSNAVQCINLNQYEDVLTAVLNSTLHKVMLELWGRHEGGGALQLLTYEVSSVPVLNPEVLSEQEREAIRNAGERLVEGHADAQDELDEAILSSIDFKMTADELQQIHQSMVKQRVEGAATEDVLIRKYDDFDDYDLDSLMSDYDPDENSSDLSDFL